MSFPRFTCRLLALCAILPALNAAPQDAPTFEESAAAIQQKLETALQELAEEQQRITDEKLPLSRELSGLDAELIEVKRQYKEVTDQLTAGTLSLTNLGTEINRRKDEVTYLTDLLSQYVDNFASRLHIAEDKRYGEQLETARLAPANSNLDRKQIFAAQTAVIDLSMTRLEEALGGTSFQGKAVGDDGTIRPGTFLMLGPAALFQSVDGASVGTAVERVGSLEPTVVPFGSEEDTAAARTLLSTGQGVFPVDPTLGDAFKVEATEETFLEHVAKGGAVMYPIGAMAGLALLVALFKWASMAFIRRPSQKKMEALLQAVADGDEEGAQRKARSMGGPVGRMLQTGAANLREPRELVEEILYESVLKAKMKLNGLLPFIAICAASAPLLGLLGTVTGIINTFKMITIMGSGDVKSLSGGISEALITTKFGLIVAIPSLLLHAFLSRKARGILGHMESAAMAFVNQLAKTPLTRQHVVMPGATTVTNAAPDPDLVRAQVSEILGELLDPIVDQNRQLQGRAGS